MITLPFPKHRLSQYPLKRFPGLGNLHRVTAHNQKAFREYLDRSVINLNDEHFLVQLLRHLAIDPEWDLAEVIANAKFRSYSLSTLFNITSMNGVGSVIKVGMYGEGCNELWSLIEHDRVYDEAKLTQDHLRPIIPVYTNILTRGYKLIAERNPDSVVNKDKIAIVAINVVELAIGWWLWMREDRTRDTGPAAYLCMWPLYTAQLIHNQSVMVNSLYEFFVKGVSTKDLFEMETVKFTTLNEAKLIKEWFTFKLDILTSVPLSDIGHLLANVDSIYPTPFFNYEDGGDNKMFVQTRWLWDQNVIKWYSIYFAIFNALGKPVGDVKSVTQRVLPFVVASFSKAPSNLCRDNFKGIAQELSQLVSKN